MLLAGHKFMPEMHFRKLGFMYSGFAPFIKKENKNSRIQISKETVVIYIHIRSYIYIYI